MSQKAARQRKAAAKADAAAKAAANDDLSELSELVKQVAQAGIFSFLACIFGFM